VRGSDLEYAIGAVNNGFVCWSMLALPVLAVLAFVRRAFAHREPSAAGAPSDVAGLERDARGVTVALLVAALFVQSEQANRWRVERDLVRGRIPEALARLDALEPSGLPPGWDPPPHAHLRQSKPSALDVIEALAEGSHPAWIGERFAPKFFHVSHSDGYGGHASVLRSELVWMAERAGEARARSVLDFLWAHPHPTLADVSTRIASSGCVDAGSWNRA
jgi:hypothetical protein